MRSKKRERLSVDPSQKMDMRNQVIWGIALTAIGAAIAIIAALGLPFLLIYSVPLIVIGLALIVWRGREETIEAIKE
jgi:hypothetical protein